MSSAVGSAVNASNWCSADVTPSKEFMDKIQAEQDAARQAALEATRLEEEAAMLHAEMTQVRYASLPLALCL